jgi:hypothetical protein
MPIQSEQIVAALFEYINLKGSEDGDEREMLANVWEVEEGIGFEGFSGGAFINRENLSNFLKKKLS